MFAVLAKVSVQAEDAIIAVVIALVCALIVWALLHVVAPAYESIMAVVVFLLVLVALLFL